LYLLWTLLRVIIDTFISESAIQLIEVSLENKKKPRSGGRGTQIMYAHVSECKNNKIKQWRRKVLKASNCEASM
jgi:L-amino acid N-acyltransferase YncA